MTYEELKKFDFDNALLFEVFDCEGLGKDGHVWRIWANGKTEGFPENTIISNHALSLLMLLQGYIARTHKEWDGLTALQKWDSALSMLLELSKDGSITGLASGYAERAYNEIAKISREGVANSKHLSMADNVVLKKLDKLNNKRGNCSLRELWENGFANGQTFQEFNKHKANPEHMNGNGFHVESNFFDEVWKAYWSDLTDAEVVINTINSSGSKIGKITPVDFYENFLISKDDGTVQSVSLGDVMSCAKLFLENKYQSKLDEICKARITQELNRTTS